MKKSLTTLGLAASLALSGAPKANAQINGTIDKTEHQIENVFNQQKNINSKDTISFNDAVNLSGVEDITYEELANSLEDPKFIDDLLNNENFKNYVKEYNYKKEDLKKVIDDTINNKETMKLIVDTLKDEDIKEMIRNGDFEALQKKVEELEQINNEQDKTISRLSSSMTIVAFVVIGLQINEISERRKKKEKNKNN